MTRSKLSDADKQKITHLFRESEGTIAQLASLFAVSSSTIRRILKTQLPGQEYDALIATKQEKRVPKSIPKQSTRVVPSPQRTKVEPIKKKTVQPSKSLTVSAVEQTADLKREDNPSQLSLPESSDQGDLAEIIADIKHDLQDQTLADEEDELEYFDEADDFEEEENGAAAVEDDLEPIELMQVLPFSAAQFPKTCYLVVDRTAELITRPLQTFGELGTIPEHELDAKTLPIFDNHRIARRFSHRTQRIVKVPNSNILRKTCPQLLAKGITRLLINGHVYSL